MEQTALHLWRDRFNSVLASAPLEQFLIMLWAVDALQSDRAAAARKFISFPEEAQTTDVFAPAYAHRWRLETLANEALIHCRRQSPLLYTRLNNCSNFGKFAIVNNALNELENAEYSAFSDGEDVFDEMHRLTQRQFEWQIGFSAFTQMYRSAYIYKGDITQDFFRRKTGFSTNELSLFCFALKVATQEFPAIAATISLTAVGIDNATRDAIMRTISLYPNQAREEAIRLRNDREKVAYRPSLLRTFPCIMTEDLPRRMLVPLIDLLMLRCTSGLFYDFLDAPGHVKDEVGKNFEAYCAELFEAIFSNDYVKSKHYYKFRKDIIETPDIFLVLPSRNTELVVECKATKMSFDAKFARNPIKCAERGYKEIAKGIFQIWRYVSHKRRGIVSPNIASGETLGLVLTLDSWLTMLKRRKDIIDLAEQFVQRVDPLIIEEDKIAVVFSTIEDLEIVLRQTTIDDFFRVIVNANTDRYRGWLLSSIHRAIAPDSRLDRPYPFKEKMSEVLTWWDEMSLF